MTAQSASSFAFDPGRIRPTSTSSRPAADPGVGKFFERHVGRRLEDRARLLRRERLLCLDPDRLAVADEHRRADAGGLDRQVRQAEDLAGLLAEFQLLVELVADEVPIHREIGLHRLDGPQTFDTGVPRTRHGLVGRKPHLPHTCRVMERLEDTGELDRRAVRVRHDPPAVDRVVVHAGDDERDALGEPERI